MITPIRTMTINQIVERKDELLMSDADIKELARNERAKVLDEFAKRLKNDSMLTMGGLRKCDIDRIAEEMRGVKHGFYE